MVDYTRSNHEYIIGLQDRSEERQGWNAVNGMERSEGNTDYSFC